MFTASWTLNTKIITHLTNLTHVQYNQYKVVFANVSLALTAWQTTINTQRPVSVHQLIDSET